MKQEIKERNSNFELLRIFAIFAIIFYHFYCQTPVYESSSSSWNHFSAMFLGSFGRCAVNLFVMIGAWYLVELQFKSIRIIRLYLTCLVFCLFFTAGSLILTHPGMGEAYKTMIRAALPFTASPLWFITDYIFLLILTPYLNVLAHSLERKKYWTLTILLLIVFSLIPTLASMVPGLKVYDWYIVKSDMGWMIALYMIVGCVKLHPPIIANQRKIAMVGAVSLCALCMILCFADTFLIHKIGSSFLSQKFHDFLEYLFNDLSSIFNLLFAFAIFFLFQDLRFTNRLVNRTAKHVLSIYIFHQVPAFIPLLWGFFHVHNWVNSPFFLVYEILTVIAVFISGWGLGFLCEKICAPLFRSQFLAAWTARWDAAIPQKVGSVAETK